ncbi:MAG: CarD family transcriptional regulator, partial [Bacilli bacterium]
MIGMIDLFRESKDFKPLYSGVENGLKEQLVTGLASSAKTMLVAALYKETGRSVAVVAHNLFQAQKLYDDFVHIASEEEVWLYPVNDLSAAEMSVASPELRADRVEVLQRLSEGKKGIYIFPVASLRKWIAPQALWSTHVQTVRVGDEVDQASLIRSLVEVGYERVAMIEGPGQVAVRGGIIDVYPITAESPIRLELFDTEVDSIRTFSLDTQRSIENLAQCTFTPAHELVLTDEAAVRCANTLQALLGEQLPQQSTNERKQQIKDAVTLHIDQISSKNRTPAIMRYASLFYEQPATVSDYWPKDMLCFFDEMVRITDMFEQIEREEAEWLVGLLDKGDILKGIPLGKSQVEVLRTIQQQKIYCTLFSRPIPHISPQTIVSTSMKTMQEFFGKFDLLKAEVERWANKGYSVVLLSSDEERKKKLELLLEDHEIEFRQVNAEMQLVPKVIHLMVGDLHQGFEYPALKLAVLTERELFNKKAKSVVKKQKLTNAERLKSHTELRSGDYIVHVNHGIGRFMGIETIEVNGIHKDYMHLVYQGDDKLYVPVEQIDLVQRYISGEGKEPKIYKLGGTEWKKVKKKVERCVQDIADDLIKLYAEREA